MFLFSHLLQIIMQSVRTLEITYVGGAKKIDKKKNRSQEILPGKFK